MIVQANRPSPATDRIEKTSYNVIASQTRAIAGSRSYHPKNAKNPSHSIVTIRPAEIES